MIFHANIAYSMRSTGVYVVLGDDKDRDRYSATHLTEELDEPNDVADRRDM